MSENIIFLPKQEQTCTENLDMFVAMCRDDLIIFGDDLDFNADMWEVSKFIELKGKKCAPKIIYSTFDYFIRSTRNRHYSDMESMSEPFLSFAKSYMRYTFGLKPFKNTSGLMTSLRILEKALVSVRGGADITLIDNQIFDEAAVIIKEQYSRNTTVALGNKLEQIGRFLSEKKLAKIHIDWKHGFKSDKNMHDRVGEEADKRRNEKMPSKAALEALPLIFNEASEPRDVLVISLIALLICTPSRVNEVLLLPLNCEVVQKDKDGNEQYGIRWFPAKGGIPMIKWVIPSMVDVAKEAISRIKKLTKDARLVAKWYEMNPTKLYLTSELDDLRGSKLTTKEVAYIMFGKSYSNNNMHSAQGSAGRWIKKNNVSHQKDGHNLLIEFSNLEKAIIKHLPERFPFLSNEINLKYSEALVLENINEYHRIKHTHIPFIRGINTQILADALRNRTGATSIFERFGLKEKDGTPLHATTHQFRHYLNTLAQAGGLSQLDIAKWSGRVNVHQNNAYDHVSADMILEELREAIGDENKMIGPLSNIEEIKKRVIIDRDEFARLKVKTAHLTEYGVCMHDFVMEPCPLHGKCMGCGEHVCLKGDKKREARIKVLKKETKTLLAYAEKAHKEGHFGAEKWIESHSKYLDILNDTCKIFDNSNVNNGTFIQLANFSVTSAVEHASKRRSESSTDHIALDYNVPICQDQIKISFYSIHLCYYF